LSASAGINGAAFVGALAAMLVVFGLAHGDGSWTQTRLLLTGVIVAAGCGAMVALILSIAPDSKLHGHAVLADGRPVAGTHVRLLVLGVLAASCSSHMPLRA
jgi:iron complex transport system permease protein